MDRTKEEGRAMLDIVKKLLGAIEKPVIRLFPYSPKWCGITLLLMVYMMIALSGLCCVFSFFLFYCSFLNRYSFSLESPGWGLILPVSFAWFSIWIGSLFLKKEAGIKSLFGMLVLTLFAWLCLIGYYELFLEYIAPETLKSWLMR